MTEQYTPTTDEVREEFIYGHPELDMDGNVVVSFDEAQARWDRWLAKRDAEVAAKAWDEGALAAWNRSTPTVNGTHYHWRSQGEPENPYRKAVES